jgi:hypothetical protein
MLFERRLREGIHEGDLTVAFRRWKRCQVVAGHHYRTGLDLVEVESVDIIGPTAIDANLAQQAGYATVDDVLSDLRGDASLPLYLIRFRRLDEPDPRDELASATTLDADEVAALAARLERMDRVSSRGPWTRAVLGQIADHPGMVSTELAQALGWPRQDFKLHVRRLKELGLTISLNVGYRLSPRGAAFLRREPKGRGDA